MAKVAGVVASDSTSLEFTPRIGETLFHLSMGNAQRAQVAMSAGPSSVLEKGEHPQFVSALADSLSQQKGGWLRLRERLLPGRCSTAAYVLFPRRLYVRNHEWVIPTVGIVSREDPGRRPWQSAFPLLASIDQIFAAEEDGDCIFFATSGA